MGIKQIPGFSNVASGFIDSPLDFNALLIERPAATFVLQASGPELPKLGLQPGDLLVVDRSITPQNGALIICPLDDELYVKQYRKVQDTVELYPSLAGSGSRSMSPDELTVWGVVTYIIHKA